MSQPHLSFNLCKIMNCAKKLVLRFCILIYLLPAIRSCRNQFSSSTTPNQLMSCLFNESTYSSMLPFEVDKNKSSSVSVRLYGLVLNNVYEKEQKVDLPMYFIMSYHDSRLKWNETSTGIPYLKINNQMLYRPAASFSERTYDKANFDESIDKRSLAYVFPDGRVTMNLFLTDTLKCSFDNFRFPFDSHECSFRLLLGATSGVEMALEDSCIYYVAPRLGLDGISLSECIELFRKRLSRVLLRETAGWFVVLENKDEAIFEAIRVEFMDGFVGSISITLQRQSLLNFFVWIFTPVMMTGISMVSIFFFW